MVYHHVSPSENHRRIISEGIEPTHASECENSLGVHLADSIDSAYNWISRLREERDELYYAEFHIYSVKIPDKLNIVQDNFLAGVNLEGFVVCTEENIPPENIGLVESV